MLEVYSEAGDFHCKDSGVLLKSEKTVQKNCSEEKRCPCSVDWNHRGWCGVFHRRCEAWVRCYGEVGEGAYNFGNMYE